ncbi:MAG: ABC transporter substrate-binding protein [Acidimicrobiales bacterium]
MSRDEQESGGEQSRLSGLSRRDFLKYGAGAGAVVLGAGKTALGAGGLSSSTSRPTSLLSHTSSLLSDRAAGPRRGGTLNVALTGGAASDTVDGQRGVDNVDFARIVSLYDALVIWDVNAQPQFTLAESITSNADATEWTIKLRHGITFHNGKPLTAEDVVYSYQRVVANNYGGASSLAPCDIKNMKAVDALTVKIPCKHPYATFIETIIGYYYYLSILPVGFDPKHPVGTGPFKFKSFTPGVQSTFVRNENYWNAGSGPIKKPYVDTLVISDYSDETSQVNALLSGQVDCVNLLSVDSIASVESGGAAIVISEAGGMTPITMRVDLAPFNDVNVRQALRLCVDRPQMRDLIFGGHGRLGNDIFSPFDPEYDHSIPQRVQDIEQAKFLLKKAGHEGLTFTMQSSPVAQGTTELAQVFAQQCSAAGVKVNIDQVNVTEFYGTNYLHWPFALDYWYYAAYLSQVAEATLPISPFNETHFASPASSPHPPGVGARYIKLYNEATATLDAAKRAEIAHEMQMIDYTQGGYIIPYFPPVIDGHAKNVGGVVPCLTGLSLSNYGFQDLWLT